MKNYEYEEGKKAQENFEEGMKALFQVPNEGPRKSPQKAGLKTLKVRPANPILPAILARLETAGTFCVRAVQHTDLKAIFGTLYE